MENTHSVTAAPDARINGIKFGLTKSYEICKSSISDCPISHASQLSNPFLGLPLEAGKCESCGTSEPGQCEGHFGYIELPIPIYHPDHIDELKKMLSLLCLKCLKFKNRKAKVAGIAERMLSSCCEETSQMIIGSKNWNGASYLELKVPSRSRLKEGFWNFLQRYGFRYGYKYSRPLLPIEVVAIFKNLPLETKRKLEIKGYYPQDGYVLKYLPVPPNCLSVPDVSDGTRTMSTDYSIALLRKVLRQVESIRNSRSGNPNFESHEIEANDLQAAVSQYLLFRGSGKAARDVDSRFGVSKETGDTSTKAWLEKMKTLFIRKGSGFSSRSVITGEPFKGVSEIGLPYEVAQKITFQELVNQQNLEFLQKLVDEKRCLTYKDGGSTYSLHEGSKGHTYLRPGQVVHRRIMDGDMVFINRPPTTHKHSLQALRVYVHDDHTVKINPLICGPLAADFDGDCIHLFYPQSLEARAEVAELFSVEKQLLSSHTGNFNLQLATDSLLSLKILHTRSFFRKEVAQQLAMYFPDKLSGPAIVKSKVGSQWTSLQILQATLPPLFSCSGEKYLISKSEILNLEVDRNLMGAFVNDLVISLFFLKGPSEVIAFFDSIQPLLMENLHTEGFSISLKDFYVPLEILDNVQENIQQISPLLAHLHHSYSESVVLQLDGHLNHLKGPLNEIVAKTSAMGLLLDSKSESALNKIVQQIGFLGLQISPKGKFYTEMLVNDMSSLFRKKYPSSGDCPTEEFGLVGKSLFRGLNPYQEMVHSISSREVIVRSSRGLTEPGTLFKNLMAILRDVVICYDGTVRNISSNRVIQFEYGINSTNTVSEFCAGDPVGVLAATAMSNPAYKAVLDSSSSSNSSWKMMKDILLCSSSFKNDASDRRVLLYLNDCSCGRKHCQENAALMVRNQLKKISLKDAATDFLIEYRSQTMNEDTSGLVGHIHLNKMELMRTNVRMQGILERCQETLNLCRKKKNDGQLFKKIDLFFSENCAFCTSSRSKCTEVPCIQFLWQECTYDALEISSRKLAEKVCPVLLQTVIKGDPRVSTVEIVWQTPSMATWMTTQFKSPKGEMILDIVLEKGAVRKSGDAWRVVMEACLPVMHLIDTRRSVPYAIKQVDELLGISCAFEQAVQRLFTSVTTVTKGVLKDHLLLLGNIMSCTGTLVGFNAGGIKSMSRSLDVRAPFMSATLYTPRKCFTTAAEKCHVDNLSSIVGACIWGKQVNVGTGSKFDLLWDTRKTELKPDKEIDVYNFLHMLNSSQPGDAGTSCIGAEVEDLDQEGDFSPERDPGLEKLTFEDGHELAGNGNEGPEDPDGSWFSWGKKAVSVGGDWNGKTTEETNWGSKIHSETNNTSEEAENGSWNQRTDTTGNGFIQDEENPWGRKVSQSSDWNKKPSEGLSDAENTWGKMVCSEEGSQKEATFSTRVKNADSGVMNADNDWKGTGNSSWDGKEDSGGSNWAKDHGNSSWDKKGSSEESSWGKKANENTWGKTSDFEQHQQDKAVQSSWGAPARSEQAKKNDRGKNSKEQYWDKKGNSEESDWGKKADESTWGTKAVAEHSQKDKPSQGGWASESEHAVSTEWNKSEEGWDKNSNIEENGWGKETSGSAWGEKVNADEEGQGNWGASATSAVESQGDRWAVASAPDSNETSANHNADSEPSPGWGSTKSWGQNKESPADKWSSGWRQPEDSSSDPTDHSSDKGSQWGRGRGRGRGRVPFRGRGRGRDSRGSSNDGEWKNRRPPHGDDPNFPALFTATGKRLDIFTADEQDILSEAELIVKNIQRIMHATGYNEGDPLSADDQAYIVNNILNHHTDKAIKIGAGLDHLMINKHPVYSDTRCFFAVSVDGAISDFSYRKSLRNYFNMKYPEKVESFFSKYFLRPNPPPRGWNRNPGHSQSDAGTSNASTPVRDDAGTSNASTPMRDDAGISNVSTPAPDDAGTSNASTPAHDDDGTPNVS